MEIDFFRLLATISLREQGKKHENIKKVEKGFYTR